MSSWKSFTKARIAIPLASCLLFLGVQNWIIAQERNSDHPYLLVADGGDKKNSIMLAQAKRTAVLPQVLYFRAWKLIKDTYYDPKFNDQDWDRWKNKYNGKLKTPDESHKAIETMLFSLGDPYTRFLDKEAFDEEKSQIEAHLFGVGMQLGMNKNHKVVVIAPIENTPAYRAGVRPGWEITHVDDKPVNGESLDQVVKRIRGEKGTNVKISFSASGKKKNVDLMRDEIPIRAVANAEILPGNIGYIRLDSFISSKANKEMKDALKRVENTDGLILDLRNNPGGLLTNAIEIANMFLKKGVIVSVIDSDNYKNSTFSSNAPINNQPLVVLINKGSASASEILSGALHDNGRAKLVGQKTFGKGLVQAINRLDDGSGINITIAKYLTPNDTDIHKHGIQPDFKVVLKEKDYEAGKGPWWIDLNYKEFDKSPTDGKDVQLNKAIEVIKQEISKDKSKSNETADASSVIKKDSETSKASSETESNKEDSD
ncbi:MAG: S41 family peptidase [Candidatus Melainabacteria bacterium]|nr:S41 family peptidase [Candidatus Melainabacteria bacterium]